MRTICLVLLAMTSGTLPLWANQAVLAGPAHRQESSTKIANTASDGPRASEDGTATPKRPDQPKVPDKRRPVAPTANGPKQLPNQQNRIQSRSAMYGQVASKTSPIRPTNLVRPPAASPSHVRHHSPNSAVITGSANSNTRSTGAINGTRMSHRP